MKKLLQNYLFNSAYQLLLIIIPLFTAPFLTRTLGKDALGIDSYVLSVVTMVEIIGAFGLNTYSSREVAYRKDNKEGLYHTFMELFTLRMILFFCVLIFYLFFLQTSKYKIYFLIQLITLTAYFFDTSWFFIGIEEMKEVVLLNTAVKILSTVLIFLLIRSPKDLKIYEVIYGSSNALGTFGLLTMLPKYLQKKNKQVLNLKRHIIPVLALFLPQAAISMYAQFDKIMIGKLSTDIAQVSFYDKGEQIVKAPLALITAFTAVVMPRIASHYIKEDWKGIQAIVSRTMNLVLLIFIPMAAGLSMVADIFVPFYLGKDYYSSVRVVQVLSPILVAIGLSNVTGSQYLVATNQTKALTISYILSAVTNVTLNALLIPSYGAVGACVGTVAAESVAFFIQYLIMKTTIGNIKLSKSIGKKLFASIVMIVLVWGVKMILGNSLGSMIAQIAVGMIVYVTILLLIHDEDIKFLVDISVKKLSELWRKQR